MEWLDAPTKEGYYIVEFPWKKRTVVYVNARSGPELMVYRIGWECGETLSDYLRLERVKFLPLDIEGENK